MPHYTAPHTYEQCTKACIVMHGITIPILHTCMCPTVALHCALYRVT